MRLDRHHGEEDGPVETVVRELTVSDPTGFHCKPAAQIAKIAVKFDGAIWVERNGGRADAKSVMALLGLLAVPEKNIKFHVIAKGRGGEEIVEKIETALNGEVDELKPPAGRSSGPARAGSSLSYKWNSLWSRGKR